MLTEYIVQVEIEMHEGPSVNTLISVYADSEADAMEKVENDKNLLDNISNECDNPRNVMCVTPQLAWES